jgi:hypothetical protein
MAEFPYCQRDEHIIANICKPSCLNEKEICAGCVYNQTLVEQQMPQRYWNKFKYLAQFALRKWMIRH